MIPISILHFYSLYLVIWLVILVILWVRDELRRRKSYGWSVVKKRLYFCDNCHLTFVTTYGLRRNAHSAMVQSEVTLDDLFGP